jgi:hypothetical protein
MGPGRKSVFSRVTKPAVEEGDKVSVFSRVTKPAAEEGDKVSVFSRWGFPPVLTVWHVSCFACSRWNCGTECDRQQWV